MEREKRKGLAEEEMRDRKKKTMMKMKMKNEDDPTDEEVDEFFRILKRMHVAMEYFGGVKSKSLISQKWSLAAMADEQQGLDEEDEADHDQEICEKEKKKIKSKDGTLDLNADPEEGV